MNLPDQSMLRLIVTASSEAVIGMNQCPPRYELIQRLPLLELLPDTPPSSFVQPGWPNWTVIPALHRELTLPIIAKWARAHGDDMLSVHGLRLAESVLHGELLKIANRLGLPRIVVACGDLVSISTGTPEEFQNIWRFAQYLIFSEQELQVAALLVANLLNKHKTLYDTETYREIALSVLGDFYVGYKPRALMRRELIQ